MLREHYLHDLTVPVRTETQVFNNSHMSRYYGKIDPIDTHIDNMKDGNIYLWSDIHFGHTNIIRYCNRPFGSVAEMNAGLIENYKNVVQPNDIVIWGGDIGFMKVHILNDMIKDLPGYKILIMGNHDFHRNGIRYEYECFDEQHICLELLYNSTKLWITHYPLQFVPEGVFNIHGHIHDKLINDGKHINMCVEHTNYRPKHINDFLTNI